jgi:hypothetical protein
VSNCTGCGQIPRWLQTLGAILVVLAAALLTPLFLYLELR